MELMQAEHYMFASLTNISYVLNDLYKKIRL